MLSLSVQHVLLHLTFSHALTPSKDCYTVLPGGLEVAKAVLRERFDYILYTGSTNVGRIVMKQAAENITPVTLELGGKS